MKQTLRTLAMAVAVACLSSAQAGLIFGFEDDVTHQAWTQLPTEPVISTDWASEGTKSLKIVKNGGFFWHGFNFTGNVSELLTTPTLSFDVHMPATSPWNPWPNANNSYYVMDFAINSAAGWGQGGVGQAILTNGPGDYTFNVDLTPIMNFNAGDPWHQVMIGANSESGSFDPKTIYIDNIRVVNGSSNTVISGNLDLGSYAGDLTQLGFYCSVVKDGNLVETPTFQVSASGAYSFTTTATGNLDLYFGGNTWLKKKVIVMGATGTVSGVNATMANGDVVQDNQVDLGDYLDLTAAFDATSAETNWNVRADLDGSGQVDLSDYLIMVASFDLVGD